MTIQYLSDLHLELVGNVDYLRRQPLKVTGDVLVVAGDSFYLDDVAKDGNFFLQWAADHYERVLLIPGNHEYYGEYDIKANGDSWEWKLKENVAYYNNKVVHIGDIDIILSTLWSCISPENTQAINIFLTDFHRATYDGHAFTTEDYNQEHKKCLRFVKQAVAESKAKHRIVVTHHVPTRLCTPKKLKDIRGGSLQEAFTVDLTDYISQAPIDYWIYGHSHVNYEAMIGGTIVTSNQLGYVFRGENEWNGFYFGKKIEL